MLLSVRLATLRTHSYVERDFWRVKWSVGGLQAGVLPLLMGDNIRVCMWISKCEQEGRLQSFIIS